jgi:hypothetical protein
VAGRQGRRRAVVRLHPHARERLRDRGASEAEVFATVQAGERFVAKFGRTGFRRNFSFGGTWRGRTYATKQVEAYAVNDRGWLVITVIVKYF